LLSIHEVKLFSLKKPSLKPREWLGVWWNL